MNAAIMAKVHGNKAAEAAMAVTRQRMAAQAQGQQLATGAWRRTDRRKQRRESKDHQLRGTQRAPQR